MNNMKIRATLDCVPGFIPAPEHYKIIRGASAYLTYNVSNKSFSADMIEQIIFTFKQGNKLTSYNMFDWLKHSEDDAFLLDKKYYELVEVDPNTGKCKVSEIEDRTGSPVEIENCYEIVELVSGENLDYYTIDDHFDIKSTATGEVFVLFCLNPDETKELKLVEMQFEIAVRLNTDNEDYLSNRDSFIIEPQQPIIVVDSLISHIK